MKNNRLSQFYSFFLAISVDLLSQFGFILSMCFTLFILHEFCIAFFLEHLGYILPYVIRFTLILQVFSLCYLGVAARSYQRSKGQKYYVSKMMSNGILFSFSFLLSIVVYVVAFFL